jgi:hypothetical protein
MNKIALRFGLNRHWNHLYFQNFSYLDPRLNHGHIQLPGVKRDQYIKRIIGGLIKFKKFEIHKTREHLDVYICKDIYASSTGFNLFSANLFFPVSEASHSTSSSPLKVGLVKRSFTIGRALLNILKTRVKFYNLYTFPIHDAELVIKYLLRDYKNKARFNAFQRLLKLGVIKGIKIKIKGRYKKSTRTQNEIYQFGQIPNTPTTALPVKLFYSTHQLLGSLGTSSLHIYIVYKKS